jgi:hypothetical protein
VGLHHRFPSYFYEAGNLFNTYLGYTAHPDAPSRLERTGRKARKPPVANTGLPDSSKSSPGVEQFSRFVEKHLHAR